MARGGATTTTTYIRPYKQAAGLSAVQTMEERFAYGLNPQKLGAVSSHLCDPATAAIKLLLVKGEYQEATARPVERGALFLQIRQAFRPNVFPILGNHEFTAAVRLPRLMKAPARQSALPLGMEPAIWICNGMMLTPGSNRRWQESRIQQK